MKKLVYVICGVSGSGKDEFIKQLSNLAQEYNVVNISSVQWIKCLLQDMGIENQRTEEGRKLISDLKIAFEHFDNYGTKKVVKEVHDAFDHDEYLDPIVFVHIREQEHIDTFKELLGNNYDVMVVKVRRPSAETIVPNNDGDMSTLLVNHDITIYNDGSLEDLIKTAKSFFYAHLIEAP